MSQVRGAGTTPADPADIPPRTWLWFWFPWCRLSALLGYRLRLQLCGEPGRGCRAARHGAPARLGRREQSVVPQDPVLCVGGVHQGLVDRVQHLPCFR